MGHAEYAYEFKVHVPMVNCFLCIGLVACVSRCVTSSLTPITSPKEEETSFNSIVIISTLKALDMSSIRDVSLRSPSGVI